MKALVACKRVIDYAVKIRVRPDGKGVQKDGVKHSINPFDEIAIEEAIRWREQGKVKEVIAVSCGDEKAPDILKTVLAMGADRAIHFADPEELTPLAVAKILSKIVVKEKADVVMLGKQAIDDDSGQVGQFLGGLLGWPQACFASKCEWTDKEGVMRVTREVDGGLETISVRFPAIITVDLRLNEPRYATLQNIMKAKSKPLAKIGLVDLGLTRDDIKPDYIVTKVEPPKQRQGGIILSSVDELVAKLKPVLKE